MLNGKFENHFVGVIIKIVLVLLIIITYRTQHEDFSFLYFGKFVIQILIPKSIITKTIIQ